MKTSIIKLMVILVLLPTVSFSQLNFQQTLNSPYSVINENDDNEELIKKVVEELNNSKVKVGISFGPRISLDSNKFRSFATIAPNDTTVKIEYEDRTSFYLSSSLVVFPWNFPKNKILKGFGFTANINLVELGNARQESSFNRKIDGGVGFAFKFHESVTLSLTYEKISKRVLQDWVPDFENKKIIVNNHPITSLDYTNDQYYKDSSSDSLGINLIFHL